MASETNPVMSSICDKLIPLLDASRYRNAISIVSPEKLTDEEIKDLGTINDKIDELVKQLSSKNKLRIVSLILSSAWYENGSYCRDAYHDIFRIIMPTEAYNKLLLLKHKEGVL